MHTRSSFLYNSKQNVWSIFSDHFVDNAWINEYRLRHVELNKDKPKPKE